MAGGRGGNEAERGGSAGAGTSGAGGSSSAPDGEVRSPNAVDTGGGAGEGFWRGQPPPETPPPVELPPAPEELKTQPFTPLPQTTDHPLAGLNGHWRQIDPRSAAGGGNAPGLTPGGYDEQLLAINVEEGALVVYVSYGDDPRTTLGGRFAAIFGQDGLLRISDVKGARTVFPERPLVLDEGRLTITPPATTPETPIPWRLEPRSGRLILGDKTFERTDPETFNLVRRGTGRQNAAPIAAAPVNPAPGAGDRPGDARPPSGNVDFFGLKSEAAHVCYIVDISGSMEGPKLTQALDELARSIQALGRGTRFFVLFFSDNALVLEQDWIQGGTPGAASFVKKLSEVRANGGTHPTPAIRHAFTQLSPRPDTVFFMTDGRTNDNLRKLFASLNGKSPKVRVHTIAFGADADANALREVARSNGGQFRSVQP